MVAHCSFARSLGAAGQSLELMRIINSHLRRVRVGAFGVAARARPRVDGEGSSRAFADGRGAGVAVRCIYSMVDRLLKYKLKLNYNIYRYVPQKASHLPPVLSPIEFSSAHSAYLTSYAYMCSNIKY